eukprot:540611-Prorocentrum_minimum.AAC.2
MKNKRRGPVKNKRSNTRVWGDALRAACSETSAVPGRPPARPSPGARKRVTADGKGVTVDGKGVTVDGKGVTVD